jgi:hypothetical protein
VQDQIVIVISASALHGCYWSRLLWVEVTAPLRNRFVAHLIFFASRVSFFFGGAFFSAVFLRHLPELEVFPPFGPTAIKALYLVVILFGLFCFSLELERDWRSGRVINGRSELTRKRGLQTCSSITPMRL